MKKRIQFYLREEQINCLEEMAKQHDVSMALIVRKAIDEYLRQPEIGLMLKYRTPQRECTFCGKDRTGQDSLIASPGGEVFCNEGHFNKWREKQKAWQDEEK